MKYLILFLLTFSAYGQTDPCHKEWLAWMQAHDKWDQASAELMITLAEYKQAADKVKQADDKLKQARVKAKYKQDWIKWMQAEHKLMIALADHKQARAKESQASAKYNQAFKLYKACLASTNLHPTVP